MYHVCENMGQHGLAALINNLYSSVENINFSVYSPGSTVGPRLGCARLTTVYSPEARSQRVRKTE